MTPLVTSTRMAPRRRPSSKQRYDHDAHKAQLMDPLEGALTFLYLMQQQAAIDLATGTDPFVRWRAAKEYDRRQRAEREKPAKRARRREGA